MEVVLETLINGINPEHIELLFGEGSFFKIEKIIWLTQQKCYQIILTLHCTDLELTKEAYPDGIDYFLKEAFELIYIDGKYIVVSSLKLKEQ
jgi:hypothetical protein